MNSCHQYYAMAVKIKDKKYNKQINETSLRRILILLLQKRNIANILHILFNKRNTVICHCKLSLYFYLYYVMNIGNCDFE